MNLMKPKTDVFDEDEAHGDILDQEHEALRRAALTHRISYYTTISGAKSAVQAIGYLSRRGLDVAPLQSYF